MPETGCEYCMALIKYILVALVPSLPVLAFFLSYWFFVTYFYSTMLMLCVQYFK